MNKDQMFFLGIDKPPSITSHDVVATLRAVTGIRKVGHTGTLDPFASGVLVLAFNRATRLIQYLPSKLKIYQTRLQLGTETETGDVDGAVVSEKPVPEYSKESCLAILNKFIGKSIQRPPIYSAIKVNGKRLYEYAREGIEVDIPSREVMIHSIELLSYTQGYLDLKIACDKGTYIRSLGADLAKSMGTVGHLSQLRRLQSDALHIDKTLDFIKLSSMVANTECWQEALVPRGHLVHPRNTRETVLEALQEHCTPAEELFAEYPQMNVDELTAERVGYGQSPRCEISLNEGDKMVISHSEKMLAIAEKRGAEAKLLRVIS